MISDFSLHNNIGNSTYHYSYLTNFTSKFVSYFWSVYHFTSRDMLRWHHYVCITLICDQLKLKKHVVFQCTQFSNVHQSPYLCNGRTDRNRSWYRPTLGHTASPDIVTIFRIGLPYHVWAYFYILTYNIPSTLKLYSKVFVTNLIGLIFINKLKVFKVRIWFYFPY